jgi:uncharacterized protein (TIGR02145 family)
MNKRKIIIIGLALVLAGGLFWAWQGTGVRSASWSFIQTDWSGGASTTAVAVHPGDAEGWDYYYSADSAVATDTPGQISLASTTSEWTQTTDADFSAGTFSGTAATSGKIVLLKPAGVSCGAGAECLGGYCSSVNGCGSCSGTVEDADANSYGVVKIGEQCWMAENLNVGVYATSTNTGTNHSDVSNNGIIEKYCYDNNTARCATDGGLYDWNEMMGYVTTAGVQGICPAGWHIPTDNEWYVLESGLATQACSASRSDWGCAPAGSELLSGGTSGFKALLAGYRNATGSFFNRGSYAGFWSSSESSSNARYRNLSSGNSPVRRNTDSKVYGFSVRCLKD